MTTLAEYLSTVAFDAAPPDYSLPSCKTYVGSADSEDAIISAWYTIAIEWCDNKMSSRDFVDSDGADLPPPAGTIIGVYEYVRAMRDVTGRGGGQGVTKIKTGDREEEYGGDGMIGSGQSAGQAAWSHIEPYVPLANLSGGGV